MQSFYVYIHKKKDTGEVFYVGKGRGNRAWSTNGRSGEWLRIAVNHGRVVRIIAEGLTEEHALALEAAFIRLCGAKLCNVYNTGGRGPVKYDGNGRPTPPLTVVSGKEIYRWKRLDSSEVTIASIGNMTSRFGGPRVRWDEIVAGETRSFRGWCLRKPRRVLQ